MSKKGIVLDEWNYDSNKSPDENKILWTKFCKKRGIDPHLETLDARIESIDEKDLESMHKDLQEMSKEE
jgi:hypothetical protein